MNMDTPIVELYPGPEDQDTLEGAGMHQTYEITVSSVVGDTCGHVNNVPCVRSTEILDIYDTPDRESAERALAGKPKGSFFLHYQRSASSGRTLTISLVANTSGSVEQHSITRANGIYKLNGKSTKPSCRTLSSLIEHLQAHREQMSCRLQHSVIPAEGNRATFSHQTHSPWLDRAQSDEHLYGPFFDQQLDIDETTQLLDTNTSAMPRSCNKRYILLCILLCALVSSSIGVAITVSSRQTRSSPSTRCTNSTALTLDCASPASRAQIASLGVCEVAAVINCCCDEFYSLQRINGSVTLAPSTISFHVGDVQEIAGDLKTLTTFDARGILSYVDLRELTYIGGELYFSDNALTSINFGKVTVIAKGLALTNNLLTSVDFGDVTSIYGSLQLAVNPQLTYVNFGHITHVSGDLDVSSNDLITISFGKIAAIDGSLQICNNFHLASMDFGSITRIGGRLSVASNAELTAVNLGNLASVEGILMTNNYLLASVSFGKLTHVGSFLYMYNNALTSIDFASITSLGSVSLKTNKLTTIGFGSVSRMNSLVVDANRLTAIHFGSIVSIGTVSLRENQLQFIDFGHISRVDNLDLFNNQLTTIDFGNIAKMDRVILIFNNLASINFGKMTEISGELLVYDNLPLTSLNCQGLGFCLCRSNYTKPINCPASCPSDSNCA
eukprot:m.176890 g.176890  ORF g.176890 m.176890 type:complete len:671 (-) comp16566_c1_seq6:1813-3825(-)